MKRRARSFAALSLVLLLSACGASQPETLSILAMDTAMTFSVYGNDADTVLSDASLEVRRLDALLSRTNPESAVTHLNAGDQLQVGEEVCGLLAAAQEYSAATGVPLTLLWHRYPLPGDSPPTPIRCPLRKSWMPCLRM